MRISSSHSSGRWHPDHRARRRGAQWFERFDFGPGVDL